MGEQVRGVEQGQLETFLRERGFSPLLFPEGDLLIVRLPATEQGRLLADEVLRRDLMPQAKALGFSHIALEISSNIKRSDGGVAQPGRAGDS